MKSLFLDTETFNLNFILIDKFAENVWIYSNFYVLDFFVYLRVYLYTYSLHVRHMCTN